MSDAQNQHEHDGPHEGPIKTPKQLILAVVYAFVVPIAIIVLLVTYVSSASHAPAGLGSLDALAVAQRIEPVGSVDVKDASTPSAPRTGEQVFAAQCTTCHTAGMMNAPKFGDAAAWAPRIQTGFEALLHSALNGKGNMPKQSGGDFSDYEVARGVVYMANKGGANFPEPKAPEGAASGAAAAPAAATATASPAAPAAAVTTAAPATAVAPTGAAPALYTQTCQVCHAAGVAGAPKFGDKAAWAPRVGQGIDGLTASAIKGKNAMPPRGGSTASDAEIKAVVSYMVSNAK